jgi:ribose transport system substrate-binding protein
LPGAPSASTAQGAPVFETGPTPRDLEEDARMQNSGCSRAIVRRGFMKSAVIRAVLCACVLAGAAGCSDRRDGADRGAGGARRLHRVPAGTPLKLALVPNSSSRFWDLARNGLNKFEQETGIKVDMVCPPHGGLDEQKAIIEDLVDQGYHGLMISVASPQEQTPFMNALCAKMNVITVDSDAPRSRRLAFVGPRHYDIGLAVGMSVVRLLPDGGTVAVFCGDLRAENVVQRLRGIQDALRQQDIRIVSRNEDLTDLTRARRQVEEVLRNYSDIDVLIGLWSYNGGIIRSVLKDADRDGDVKVVAVAEEEETWEGISEGTIQYGVGQTAFDFAYLGAKLLRDLAYEGASAVPPGGELNTGFVLVDRHNLTEYRDTVMRQSSY